MKIASRITLAAALLGTLLTLGIPPGQAHPPRRRPVVVAHGRPLWHPAVRIVVGKPRPVKKVVVVDGVPGGAVDMDIEPADAKVFVDGTYRGTADDFDGRPQCLHLRPGPHRIRLVSPDGQEAVQTVTITPGTEVDLKLDL